MQSDICQTLFSFFLTVFCLCLADSALAQINEPQACPQPPPTEIIVKPFTEEITVDNSKTYEQLQDFSIASMSPFADKESQVHGLMQGPVNMTSKITVAWQKQRDNGKLCFWFDKVELLLKLSPVIYIAKHTKPGTCRYNAIYNHELKHVNVDRALVNKYVPIYKQHIKDYIAKQPVYGPYPEGQKNLAQKNMSHYLRESLKLVQHLIETERMEKQLEIDTLEEYTRVARECDDKYNEFRKEAERRARQGRSKPSPYSDRGTSRSSIY